MAHKKETNQSFYLGDMVSPQNRSYHSNYSNFELSLNPKEKSTLIIRYNSVGPIEVGWNVFDYAQFIKNENKNNLFILVFLGFVLAMFVYKSFIYFHIKDKEYLIYALMMGTIFISQLSLNGVMHLYLFEYIDTFTITLVNWVFVHMFLVFMWIFTYYFFNINKQSRFFYPLVSVIVYNVFIVSTYTLSYIDVDILKVTPIISTIAFFESIALLLFSAAMIYQKKSGAVYFFIGHLFYIASVFVYIMLLNGDIVLNTFTQHSVDIGLLCVSLLMSLALSRKFKYIKEENKKQKDLIEKNKQYTMIGATIGYVTHQWKQPLSILGSQTTNLLVQIEKTPNDAIKSIKPKIQKLEDNIIYINDTLNSIKDLFSFDTKDKIEEFSINLTINKIKQNYKTSLEKENITLNVTIEKDISINGDINLFIHSISNIIDNCIDAFTINKIKNKTIDIHIYQSDDSVSINIKDNAGGVEKDILSSIFDPFVTNKEFGTGIGLAFVKNIIESKFNGQIEATNTQYGASFIVTIKNEENK